MRAKATGYLHGGNEILKTLGFRKLPKISSYPADLKEMYDDMSRLEKMIISVLSTTPIKNSIGAGAKVKIKVVE